MIRNQLQAGLNRPITLEMTDGIMVLEGNENWSAIWVAQIPNVARSIMSMPKNMANHSAWKPFIMPR